MSSSTASRAASTAFLLAALAACGPKPAATIIASGVFEAIEVSVGVKVPGQIKTIPVEEGHAVKAGDLVAEIDCVDLGFQLSQAKANLALAEAQRDLVKKGARREDVRQAAAGETQAEVGYGLAKSDFERVQRLHNEGAVTQKLLDDAEGRMKVAAAQKDQAAEMVRKVSHFSRVEEIAMAQARVDAARVAVEGLDKKIGDCRVTAPIAGWVLRKVFEAGEMAGPAATLAVLADLTRLRAVVYLPEAELFKVRLGDRVKITTDGHPGRFFPGTVSYLSQKAEFTPKNVQTRDERVKQMFAVKILVENPDLALKPGLPMDVDFGTR